MTAILVLAGVGALSVSVLVTIVALAVSIHRANWHRANAPKSKPGALASRIVGGVRYLPGHDEEAGQ
jgi:hypothetical protein